MPVSSSIFSCAEKNNIIHLLCLIQIERNQLTVQPFPRRNSFGDRCREELTAMNNRADLY